MTMPETEWDEPGPAADALEEEAAAAGDALEATAAGEGEEEPQLYFASLPDFVDQFLTKAFRRKLTANTPWCSEWWKHGEAVCVLSALWRAWEALRLEPGTGMSVWWRDHCYPHMAKLMDREGTFKNCTQEQHNKEGAIAPLPWKTPPRDLYEPLTYGV